MSALKKVLIVDDSKLIHQMYELVFMRYKECTLVDAMNGLEALEILSREDGFDLILLDINMPVMNGIQFMEKLKETGAHRTIPVIVISTEGKEEETIRAMNLGAWGYIVKPFKSENLYDLINKVMDKRTAALMEGNAAK
ncbi:MAG TPA: response regulator [Thermodesulfovibrionales bacterium]|nr:response regulator [Thermodesulfovibrionales bacterium]